MRKPRDFDAEQQALSDKATLLKERKMQQLGELVIATRADSLDAETLAGALLAAVQSKDISQKEVWRKKGAGFFRRPSRKGSRKAQTDDAGDQAKWGDGLRPVSAAPTNGIG